MLKWVNEVLMRVMTTSIFPLLSTDCLAKRIPFKAQLKQSVLFFQFSLTSLKMSHLNEETGRVTNIMKV